MQGHGNEPHHVGKMHEGKEAMSREVCRVREVGGEKSGRASGNGSEKAMNQATKTKIRLRVAFEGWRRRPKQSVEAVAAHWCF